MNVLFLTLQKMDTLKNRGIYHDLMREFQNHDHHLYIVSPVERREQQPTVLKSDGNVHFLNIRTLNIQKANIIEKGFATISLEHLFLRGVKKYFSNVKFDLVLYSTPPITFSNVVSYVKKRDGAKAYLLLKDIFPQNAVDMKMLKKNGPLYIFFRQKEKKLYEISDAIGCMSEANRTYLLKHNREIEPSKVEVNPNSIEPVPVEDISIEQKSAVKKKYGIPEHAMVFIYGGNLGIPQGLDFLLETISAKSEDASCYFMVVGSGTEYERISNWFATNQPANAKLLSGLPKVEYDDLVKACDVGIIFLHRNFTIPNFPSRLLSYLEFKLPVLVAADPNTDIGTEVEKNKCGISVLSGDIQQMTKALDHFVNLDPQEYEKMRENARNYLENEFLVQHSYDKIIRKLFGNNV